MGFHEVLGALYARMGLDQLFPKRQAMAARLFRQAVLLRLAAPGGSKRAHARPLSREEGVEVPVHKFYRRMDAVNDQRIVQLQAIVAREVTDLLAGKLEVLFFDVTPLAFASDKPDELRKKRVQQRWQAPPHPGGVGPDADPRRITGGVCVV